MANQGTTSGRIGTVLDQPTIDALREVAKREDRSIASVIRRAVERELRLHEQEAA